MALPLYMLKGLQIPKAQKITLAGMFCLVCIDIIFDILRTVYTVNGGAVALATIWDILEAEVAVIISCLPTYRALLKTARKRDASSYKNLVPNTYGEANQNRVAAGLGATNSLYSKNSSQQLDPVVSVHMGTWPAGVPRSDA